MNFRYTSEPDRELQELIQNSEPFRNIVWGWKNSVEVVKVICNWNPNLVQTEWYPYTSCHSLYFKGLKLVDSTYPDDKVDWWYIINSPIDKHWVPPRLDRVVYTQMEPNMHKNPQSWGRYSSPPDFACMMTWGNGWANNAEFHVQPNESDVKLHDKKFTTGIVSTVLSAKMADPGQAKRVSFVKFVDCLEQWRLNKLPEHINEANEWLKKGLCNRPPVTREELAHHLLDPNHTPVVFHVFGNNCYNYNHYMSSPPHKEKNMAITPYTYHFNAENNRINWYVTEKLMDSLYCGTHAFYSGAPNYTEVVPDLKGRDDLVTNLDLDDFMKDYLKLAEVANNPPSNKVISDAQYVAKTHVAAHHPFEHLYQAVMSLKCRKS